MNVSDLPHPAVGVMTRRKVDAGISAMFNAVGYTFYGNCYAGEMLRQFVAETVRASPGAFSEELVRSILRLVRSIHWCVHENASPIPNA